MKEIEIGTIMKQLGFSPSQVERWKQIQMKPMSQSPELTGGQILNLPTQHLIHNASRIAASEFIVI